MWDSGQTDMVTTTEGNRCPDISYGSSVPLTLDGSTYYWRIKFWDDEGNSGYWSTSTASFIMSNQTDLQNLSYTYDSVGNITSITDTSDTNFAKTLEYEYDDLYRLTVASSTNAVNNQDFRQTYSYNAIGNITNKSDVGNYTYSSVGRTNPNAVTSINGINYSYSNNGNLISDSQWTHTWDYRNRLTQSTKATTTIRYTYDDQDQRILYSVNGTATTTTVNNLYEITGATSTKYIYANNQLVATTNGTDLFFNHNDHLSGSNVITNASGTVAELIDYYPFGSIRLDEKQGTFNEKKKFTGHVFDADTGLNYMKARYQSGTVGKFFSIDSESRDNPEKFLADPQQMNSYSYARNNPIIYNDPSGKCIWDACVLEGATAISVANIAMAGLAGTSAGLLMQQALQKSNFTQRQSITIEPSDEENMFPRGVDPKDKWKAITILVGVGVGGVSLQLNEFKDEIDSIVIYDNKDKKETLTSGDKQGTVKPKKESQKYINGQNGDNQKAVYPNLNNPYQATKPITTQQNKQKPSQSTQTINLTNNQASKKPVKIP